MQKKKNINLIFTIIIIFLLLFSAYFFLTPKSIEETSLPNITNPIGKAYGVKDHSGEIGLNNKATLEINGKSYQADILENENVYDLMIKLRDKKEINFKDKTYIGIGKFIEEINEVRGNGTKYWIYYVNGKKAQIGVSNYKIKPGDVVSWKYEKDIN